MRLPKAIKLLIELAVLFFCFQLYICKKIWVDLIYRGIISRLLFGKKSTPPIVSTWQSRFDNLPEYPFNENYFKYKDVAVHYLDEGPKDAKKVIVCLHGEPSWSFLYRKMIPVFVQQGYRVIAPDFIGFGKSEKYTDPDAYSYDLHRSTLVALCHHLKLKDFTLVVQDWGGLIGLGCVPALQDKIGELVIMNTGLPHDKSKGSVLNMIPFLIWLLVVRIFDQNLPVGLLFKFALLKASPEVLQGYDAPFPNASFKAGVYKFPLMVPVPFFQPNPDVVKGGTEARNVLEKWEKPALILWSTKDPITRPLKKNFVDMIPNAKSDVVIPEAGHFLQEDNGPLVAEEIVKFLKSN